MSLLLETQLPSFTTQPPQSKYLSDMMVYQKELQLSLFKVNKPHSSTWIAISYELLLLNPSLHHLASTALPPTSIASPTITLPLSQHHQQMAPAFKCLSCQSKHLGLIRIKNAIKDHLIY